MREEEISSICIVISRTSVNHPRLDPSGYAPRSAAVSAFNNSGRGSAFAKLT
jgi:hypothetical protein